MWSFRRYFERCFYYNIEHHWLSLFGQKKREECIQVWNEGETMKKNIRVNWFIVWKSVLWIMDSFLSAVRALILTAPIHYRWSISESKWCSFSKSDEEIHPSTSWITWGWVHFQHIFIFFINFPLKDLIPKTTFKNEVTEEKRSCSIWDMQIRTLDINKCGFSPVFFKAAACSFQLSIKTAIIHRSPRELWPWRETTQIRPPLTAFRCTYLPLKNTSQTYYDCIHFQDKTMWRHLRSNQHHDQKQSNQSAKSI